MAQANTRIEPTRSSFYARVSPRRAAHPPRYAAPMVAIGYEGLLVIGPLQLALRSTTLTIAWVSITVQGGPPWRSWNLLGLPCRISPMSTQVHLMPIRSCSCRNPRQESSKAVAQAVLDLCPR